MDNEQQKQAAELEKLQLEVAELRAKIPMERWVGRYLPTITALLAIIALLVGVYDTRRSRERESKRPFFEEQLNLYFEASNAASTIATSKKGEKTRLTAEARFWQLYWGPLAVVEDVGLSGDLPKDNKGKPRRPVEAAMIAFGKALQEDVDDAKLRGLSLKLAYEIREAIKRTWDVGAWEPADAAKREAPAKPK